ncbi:hypothetical protein ACFX19_022433 [Malus domestica]
MGCSTTQSWGINNGSGVRYDSNQIAEENYSGILLCFLLCYGLLLLSRKPRKILLLVEKKAYGNPAECGRFGGAIGWGLEVDQHRARYQASRGCPCRSTTQQMKSKEYPKERLERHGGASNQLGKGECLYYYGQG